MKYCCNPININYRYQFNADPRLHGRLQICREAADPSMILFGGRYYIFASMTLGVWVSEPVTLAAGNEFKVRANNDWIVNFGVNDGVPVYLDESLKRFETVFPACGSANSAIEMTMSELEEHSGSLGWVDVAKLK